MKITSGNLRAKWSFALISLINIIVKSNFNFFNLEIQPLTPHTHLAKILIETFCVPKAQFLLDLRTQIQNGTSCLVFNALPDIS